MKKLFFLLLNFVLLISCSASEDDNQEKFVFWVDYEKHANAVDLAERVNISNSNLYCFTEDDVKDFFASYYDFSRKRKKVEGRIFFLEKFMSFNEIVDLIDDKGYRFPKIPEIISFTEVYDFNSQIVFSPIFLIECTDSNLGYRSIMITAHMQYCEYINKNFYEINRDVINREFDIPNFHPILVIKE